MQSEPNKIAIVTGASSGIGLAACKALVATGFSVLGIDIGTAPPIHTNFSFLQRNILHRDAPQDIIAACLKEFGPRIDALLNVAGVMDQNSGADNVLDEDWDRIIAINLTAPVRLMREVLKVMKAQKSGSIVNVSSKAGISGAVAGVAYTASKHGIVGVTKNTAWLFKEEGIRCNAICPGAVKTRITDSMDLSRVDVVSYAKIEPVLNVHVNTSTGEGAANPALIADLLVFLASDLSQGINGAIIPIDNGFSVI